ncbi:hypothetical protein ACH5RR_033446 [Cinchona calisaya]|uniref:Uncharacterized protein n=1 Tax=Cinchona calisaya TaxID=153742 RepID=A0ABD2YKZ8_9GENT
MAWQNTNFAAWIVCTANDINIDKTLSMESGQKLDVHVSWLGCKAEGDWWTVDKELSCCEGLKAEFK